MTVQLNSHNNMMIAEVQTDDDAIRVTGDALDLLADAHDQGADGMIVYERSLTPAFFDLRTGLAGDILQKFSIYGMRLAIVGEFDTYDSKSLQAFIIECNRSRQIRFCPDRSSALARLSR